jgi:hypothetical protein
MNLYMSYSVCLFVSGIERPLVSQIVHPTWQFNPCTVQPWLSAEHKAQSIVSLISFHLVICFGQTQKK